MQLTTIITDYGSQRAAIHAVRDEVFIAEQGVQPSEEYDDRDEHCVHVLVMHGTTAVATGRIDLEKGGRIGRLAVRQDYRRQGIGRRAMLALEGVATAAAAPKIWFHAQTHAVAFYQSLGYHVCSQEFMEANIPHVTMEKTCIGP